MFLALPSAIHLYAATRISNCLEIVCSADRWYEWHWADESDDHGKGGLLFVVSVCALPVFPSVLSISSISIYIYTLTPLKKPLVCLTVRKEEKEERKEGLSFPLSLSSFHSAMAKVGGVSHLMARVAELRRAAAAHERRAREEGQTHRRARIQSLPPSLSKPL